MCYSKKNMMAYIYNILDRESEQEMRQHIRECESCQNLLEDIENQEYYFASIWFRSFNKPLYCFTKGGA